MLNGVTRGNSLLGVEPHHFLRTGETSKASLGMGKLFTSSRSRPSFSSLGTISIIFFGGYYSNLAPYAGLRASSWGDISYLPAPEILELGPIVDIGRTELLKDLLKLVLLGLAWEHRLKRDHLHEDATNAPDIDRRGVGLRPQEDIRRTVPQCNDLVSVVSYWDSEGTRKAEVSQFQDSFLRGMLDGPCRWGYVAEEDVLGLEVSMQDFLLV